MEPVSKVRPAPAPIEGFPFVGRKLVLEELDAVLARARSGHGSLVLIGGEPGIGKTRLAHELTQRAKDSGMHALWGSCWEHEGTPAFWPWTQVLRAAARELAPDARSDGPHRLHVAPDLHAVPAAADAIDAGSAATQRFAMLDRMAVWLRAACAQVPMLLVIDDLQWADEGSLQLLRFLSAEVRDQALAIVCTYRDVEVDAAHPHAALFAELSSKALPFALPGLSRSEVAELAAHARHAPEEGELHARTGGNPLFVRELLRSDFSDARAPSKLSASIRQVLERRLRRLSDPCRQLLSAASVVGPRFSLGLLGEVVLVAHDIALLQALLDEAVAARLLERCHGGDEYAFVHALVRDTCYALASDAQLRALHRRTADALAQRHAHDLSERHAQLAFHYQRAGTPADLRAAQTQLELAARSAMRLCAHADAATHFRAALQLLEREGGASAARLGGLLLELGAAEMSAGASEAGRAALKRVAALAQQTGDGELLAHAALHFGAPLAVGKSDMEEVELLTAACNLLPDLDSPLRAHLLARLSTALMFATNDGRCSELADAALAMARRLGDKDTLARVLATRHQALWDGGLPDERLQLVDEAIALADAQRDPRLSLELHGLRLGDLLELGDVARYRIEVQQYAEGVEVGRHLGLGWHVLLHRANVAMLDGQLQLAEQLAGESLAHGRRYGQPGIELLHASIFMMVRFFQGHSRELLPVLSSFVDQFPAIAVYRAALAASAGEVGALDLARVHFDFLAADDFARLPHDYQRIACVALLCGACHQLGDAGRAQALYAILTPYRRFNVRVTRHGTSTLGSTEHFLGMLALTAGRLADAIVHLEAAVEQNRRLGFLSMLSSSQRLLADALRQRGEGGDLQRAELERMRADALTTSFGLGLVFQPPPASTTAAPSSPPVTAPVPSDDACFQREGESWRLRYAGTELRLRDSVGMRLLARLLAEPGREFAALELRSASEPGIADGDAGPVLDERALAAYKQRRAQLNAELEQAEAWSDPHRSARARDELDALEQQLSQALGLGGKRRRSASSLERARVTVTKALRTTLSKIAREHPRLGDHLQRSVRTGHVCIYHPDPANPTRWTVS